jgi:hypothetical protein
MKRIIIIAAVLVIAGVLYYTSRQTEGFKAAIAPIQGQFPAAKQSSFIPSDSATATTANPQLAKPDIRDFVDARDTFQYFLDIYSPASARASGASLSAIDAMLRIAPAAQQAIQRYIEKPELIPSREVLHQAVEARSLADAMRRVGPADAFGVGWPRPGCISYRNDDLMAV